MPDPRTLPIALLAVGVTCGPLPAQDGKTAFALHCAACHMTDRQLVGPSLVEVSKLYTGKIDEFLAWCREPKQKRQGVIQMPPMTHVGEDNLRLIHSYILESSKGVKEVKVKGLDPFYASPSMRRRPQVRRIFMPEAGPAAIAVAVNDELHYCWDAGECRLRYIWKGDFIDGWAVWRGNGDGLAKIQGEVLLREERSPLPFLGSAKPKFLGYHLQDGLPAFRYRAGKVEITEEIRPSEDGKSLERIFSLSGGPSPLRLNLTPSERIAYSSRSGSLKNAILELKTNASGRYTVTLTPR